MVRKRRVEDNSIDNYGNRVSSHVMKSLDPAFSRVTNTSVEYNSDASNKRLEQRDQQLSCKKNALLGLPEPDTGPNCWFHLVLIIVRKQTR